MKVDQEVSDGDQVTSPESKQMKVDQEVSDGDQVTSPESKQMKADQEISDDTADGSADDEHTSDRITGVCVRWCHDKGYGFIKRDDGKGDVLAHIKSCVVLGDQQNIKVGSK